MLVIQREIVQWGYCKVLPVPSVACSLKCVQVLYSCHCGSQLTCWKCTHTHQQSSNAWIHDSSQYSWLILWFVVSVPSLQPVSFVLLAGSTVEIPIFLPSFIGYCILKVNRGTISWCFCDEKMKSFAFVKFNHHSYTSVAIQTVD